MPYKEIILLNSRLGVLFQSEKFYVTLKKQNIDILLKVREYGRHNWNIISFIIEAYENMLSSYQNWNNYDKNYRSVSLLNTYHFKQNISRPS